MRGSAKTLLHLQTPTDENRRSAAINRVGKNRKKGQGHPATADLAYSDEEFEFLMAIEAFKSRTGRKFPTWAETLRVLKSLGWERINPMYHPSEA